jgi:predicted transcriptional regulator
MKISKRKQVMKLLSEGVSMGEIADRLHVEPAAVSEVAQAQRSDDITPMETALEMPEDVASERIKLNLRAATLRLSERLAREVSRLPTQSLSVALGIAVDKLALLSGSPTSISSQIRVSVDHRSLLDRITKQRENQVTKNDAIDVSKAT